MTELSKGVAALAALCVFFQEKTEADFTERSRKREASGL